MKLFLCYFLFNITFILKLTGTSPIANVVGYIKFGNGLGRVTTVWADILSNNGVDVNFIDTRPKFSTFEDAPTSLKGLRNTRAGLGAVSILTDNLWLPELIPSLAMPDSLIRIAYSMCESTKIPAQWVDILNSKFDAVIVPNSYYIDVYKNSGVTIPIFVLPIALYLEDFLKLPLKKKAHTIFTFGISASLSKNKNVSLLVRAFAKEFGNKPNVQLKIHTPTQGPVLEEIKNLVRKLGLKNVKISSHNLLWSDYISFIQSLDCYVLLSRGEGFSMTVYEAMAAGGLPAIISDNTAHKTICKTGLVYAVKSDIIKPSDREFYKVYVGNNFDCHEKDVRKALKSVKNHYPDYLKMAVARRNFANTYLRSNLSKLYVNFVAPPAVLLGDKNEVTNGYLMTTSAALHKKYSVLKQ